ncbi:hypothetical protein HMI56_001060 [Coelomomyces lativittatus]|nr:hypothetical protein HMI56_001060 [Coelomomyces lativittatus]
MPNVPISQEQLIKIKQLSRKLRHALCHSTNPSPNDFLHFYNSELFSWTPPIQNSFETNLPTHYPDFEEIESSSPEKVSSKKNFELISSEKPLPKLKKIKTSHETHSSETLQPMDTISPSISESSPSLNLNPSSTFKHANSHPHLFTDFLEASTSLSMPLHSNNTSGIYDETLSSTLATLEVTSSPISCLPHPQPNDERRDSPSWTMAHLKVPTSLDSQRTQPLQRSPTPHLPSLMESSPQSMTDRHMTTMSPSSPPAQVSTMLTPSTPIMMLHSSPNDSSPTTGITMLLPPSRRVFSSPDETPFFPSSSPMLPPLFIHSPSSKSIQPSSSLLMLEDPFMMDSTKSPTACFNQTNSTMHPISLNLLSQEVKEISNTEPLTDQEQGYEMKYIEEESGNSSLRARHTKVLARNKIVRLFHRYGDFVKLKPSEKGDVSDSDPDLEDLGSQNSNSSSSTGSHSLDLPFSQHTTYSPHSSPSNSLAPPSPFGSNDVNSHPSFNASSLSKKKIISIPSKRSLWTRPKSLLTPAATTFVENPKSLFDRMQVKSVKKKKYMDPSYLSTLPTSVLTPFLYPSLEETELPIFLRVAARTILRNISTTMPRSKKINQLYGDPKKKYISFQSSKPVLFALTKEIHDAQLGETTNVLSLLEKGIRPYSKRHRTPRVEGRPLARPNFPRSNHQMKKKSMRPTRRPLKPSFYMSGSHLDPSRYKKIIDRGSFT